jgi:hypothetical protein
MHAKHPAIRTAVRAALAALPLAVALPLAACGASSPGASSPGGGDPTVPALASSASPGGTPSGPGGSGQSSSPARAAALHDAAQCIRAHGIPGYADPVLTPSGAVYSDLRSFQNAGAPAVGAVTQACGTLMAQASLNPQSEPPAPPQLVQAGVRAAECFRAHGLPNVKDPTAQTPYTPGHGFGLDSSEVPAGGKQDPAFQQAIRACIAQDDAELRASTLASLGNDG